MDRECMDKINRYCQKQKLRLVYATIGMNGPPHDRMFTVVVKINDEEYGKGTGKNKKEANAMAAKETWEMIKKQAESPSDVQGAELMTTPVMLPPESHSDYVSQLDLYSQKKRHVVDYPNNVYPGADGTPIYSFNCTISGVLYGIGTGASPTAAKQAAAKKALEKLNQEEDLTMGSEPSEDNSAFSKQNTHSDIIFRDSASSLVEKVKNMEVGGRSPFLQKDAKSPAQKYGRKLAPNFDNARKKQEEKKMSDSDGSLSDLDTSTSEENGKYTVNKKFLKRFRNIEPIGKGGFGNVFKATEIFDERTCAIKRVRFTNNVMREVKLLAKLDHENIVRYYCSWKGHDRMWSSDSSSMSDEETPCLFIQMELCEQGSLANWINKNRQDKKYNQMAQDKFLQILKGVKYIHSEGLIHRDLKPQNIFISREDKIKIGDFGLVTCVTYETLTENRGTQSYMAPEQFGGKYGMEVDIYALGLIWFEILSAMSRHEKQTIWTEVRNGNLPKDFTNKFPTSAPLIKKMLSKDASGRYSAAEILDFISSGKGHASTGLAVNSTKGNSGLPVTL
ncbi:interferon-induced, double-stranded RNA-activated protein kinase isoform 1-T2 [Porphyrio hochstetteri]